MSELSDEIQLLQIPVTELEISRLLDAIKTEWTSKSGEAGMIVRRMAFELEKLREKCSTKK